MNTHDDQQTNNELARTLGRIEATLEKFDETLTRFDHQLFGNGQPGKLTVVDDRLGVLETFKSTAKGAIGTISAIISAVGLTELFHLFAGRK